MVASWLRHPSCRSWWFLPRRSIPFCVMEEPTRYVVGAPIRQANEWHYCARPTICCRRSYNPSIHSTLQYSSGGASTSSTPTRTPRCLLVFFHVLNHHRSSCARCGCHELDFTGVLESGKWRKRNRSHPFRCRGWVSFDSSIRWKCA